MLDSLSAFWVQYGSLLLQGTRDTSIMVLSSTVFAYLLGLPLGVLLVITQPYGIWPRRAINQILGWIINVGRSLPFIILMISVMLPDVKIQLQNEAVALEHGDELTGQNHLTLRVLPTHQRLRTIHLHGKLLRLPGQPIPVGREFFCPAGGLSTAVPHSSEETGALRDELITKRADRCFIEA